MAKDRIVTELCEWGGISIPYIYIAQRTHDQNANAIRQGPEGQRADQQGLIKFKQSDFSGGLFKRVGDWTRDGNRYAYNEGLMTHIPGGLYLPYKLTTQTSITSDADISAFRAGNKRVRSLVSALGTNALRFYLSVGTKLYSDTSSSDPSLVVLATLTDNIHSMAIGKMNNTAYLFLGTDGTTNDISGIADPIDSPGTVTTLSALSGGDIIEAIANFPTVGNGFMLYYGKYGGTTTGLWYSKHSASVPATLLQCVNAASYSLDNTSNSTTTVTTTPTIFRQEAGGGTIAWSNLSNVTSSNNTYSTVDFTAAGQTTYRALFGGFDFSSVPRSAIVTGVTVSIERKEDTASVNAFDTEVRFYVDGTAIGQNRADVVTEWPNTDTTKTYGASTDRWSHEWTWDELQLMELAFQVAGDDIASSTELYVDYITVAVTYRLSGTGISLPLGGWSPGPLPSQPNRWPLILPSVDEQSTVLTPRELWWADVSYDPSGDRPLVTLSKPNTGLSHIEFAFAYSGGLLVGGDTQSNVGKQVKLIDSNGQVRDLGFLGQDGFPIDVGAVGGFPSGRVAVIDVAWTDVSDAQWWYYFDGTWHASTPLQSKSASIAALPLAWAESSINTNQQTRYRVYPSSTHTAVGRMFQPRNIFEDPLVNNTTQVKQDGPLFLRTPELNLGGPEEAYKAIMAIDFLGRLASATGGSYGTVRNQLDTGGDTAVTSAEVDNTFDTAFENYLVPTSGVSFKTIICKISLNHEAGTSKTPNGVPFLYTMVVEWPLLSIWDVYLDEVELAGRYDHISNFYDALNTVTTSKVTQQFRWGSVDVPAIFEGMNVIMYPVPIGSGPVEVYDTSVSNRLSGKPYLTFRQVVGTTA